MIIYCKIRYLSRTGIDKIDKGKEEHRTQNHDDYFGHNAEFGLLLIANN